MSACVVYSTPLWSKADTSILYSTNIRLYWKGKRNRIFLIKLFLKCKPKPLVEKQGNLPKKCTGICFLYEKFKSWISNAYWQFWGSLLYPLISSNLTNHQKCRDKFCVWIYWYRGCKRQDKPSCSGPWQSCKKFEKAQIKLWAWKYAKTCRNKQIQVCAKKCVQNQKKITEIFALD